MKKIFLILIIAFIIRIVFLEQNLFFGYEQGRDFLKLTEIASGDPALIGPKTDIDGLFHGAFSYYLLMPSFIIFGGNPYLVLLSLILVHIASIYFLYKLAISFKGKQFALLVTLLYAVSYSSAVYARWLSNPNLVPALTIFFLYFLHFAEKKKIYLALAAVSWALIFHLQVVAALILILPGAYYIFSKKVLSRKNIILSALAIAVLLSSYLAFNFKNENILFDGFSNFISGGEQSPGSVKLDEFYNAIVDDYFPAKRLVAFVLFWFTVAVTALAGREFNSRFILVLYFSAPLVFILVGVSPLRHLFILSPLFTSLLVANTVLILNKKRKLLISIALVATIAVGSLHTVFTRLPGSDRNFIYHAQRMYFGDMKRLLNYVYTDAAGNAFSYDYYSIPYWHNDSWKYMFNWYGKWKFGYGPDEDRARVFYVLIEPDETQPKYQEDWYKKLSTESKLLEEYTSGKLRAEKREQL